jgi:hypothetical protein
VAQLIKKKSPFFIEVEGSLPCPQEATAEPVEPVMLSASLHFTPITSLLM